MQLRTCSDQSQLIGKTPLLKIPSLSKLTGSEILLKCENQNPGGSVKDRAALGMVQAAIERGDLKPGMTIVEGTAGNTGIGLALVGKALGFKVLVVMPRGQTLEKQRMVELHGAELHLVDPCPFKNPGHFYHTARRIAEEAPDQYWWADQFENTDNADAHFTTTGPEIWQQTEGKIDGLASVAGTGGTLGGTSRYLKEKNPQIHTALVDPNGSGLKAYFDTGEFKSEGGSITEGIGIMRLTKNFAMAKVDSAMNFKDEDLIGLSRYVRDQDGLVLGSSSALNTLGAAHLALKLGKGKRVVTFACDLGERSYSKLYNESFLQEKGLEWTRSIEKVLGL